MIEAILKRGFFIGVFLGVKRIIRCMPWSKGGFDKVPDKKSARTPKGIGAMVKLSNRTIPATGSTATAVSLNFDNSFLIKEGSRPF